jgi:uncharacterized protein YxeA
MKDNFIKYLLILINIILVIWCSLLTWKQITYIPTDIAQLSVRALFDDFLKEQATNSEPATSEANMAAYSRELEVILKDLSEKENVIILVSEAVLSDHVVDITPEIKAILKRRLKKRAAFKDSGQMERGDD